MTGALTDEREGRFPYRPGPPRKSGRDGARPSLQGVVDDAADVRSDVVKAFDNVMSRISVVGAETGITGRTRQRLKTQVVVKEQVNLKTVERNKDIALRNINTNFRQNVLKQNLGIIKAKGEADSAFLSGLANISAATASFKIGQAESVLVQDTIAAAQAKKDAARSDLLTQTVQGGAANVISLPGLDLSAPLEGFGPDQQAFAV